MRAAFQVALCVVEQRRAAGGKSANPRGFLNACASIPQVVTAPCPAFPMLPPELMQPPPTLYLLPDSPQTQPSVKD